MKDAMLAGAALMILTAIVTYIVLPDEIQRAQDA
jgi:hypothetical protein